MYKISLFFEARVPPKKKSQNWQIFLGAKKKMKQKHKKYMGEEKKIILSQTREFHFQALSHKKIEEQRFLSQQKIK